MKAFLSHSSRDATFVLAVADELGRQFTWLDRQQFDTGDEFFAAMESGLTEVGVFVLFASKSSLESTFVNFEITEARRQLVAKAIDKVLVFIIDEGLTYRDLPLWLQRYQATTASSPRVIARAVRHALDNLARTRQRSLFVGRTRELEALASRLLPADGSRPPRSMIVWGLPGIGRRALAERAARDHWGLRRVIEVRVEAADDWTDLAIKLADRYETYTTFEALQAIDADLRGSAPERVEARVISYLRAAMNAKELVVFVDSGGLLNNDAGPSEMLAHLLRLSKGHPDLYFAVVTNRKPLDHDATRTGVAAVQVRALSSGESKQLVSALASRDGIPLGPELVTALAQEVAGYPPSAYHCVELVRSYGIDAALGDRDRLRGPRLEPLSRYLSALPLHDSEKRTLRVLAANSPLPFVVLGEVLAMGTRQLARVISMMVDASLVATMEDGGYHVAEPVADLIVRAFGDATKDEYAQVAAALHGFLHADSTNTPKLEFARVLARAHMLSDVDGARDAVFSLASDLLVSSERFYHRREYRRAAEFSAEVLLQRPKNYEARYTLIRALIKLGEYDRSSAEIEVLRGAGFLREASFLSGFLARHRGRSADAIKHYRAALQRGYSGLAIHREMAQCHLLLGELDEARSCIQKAERQDKHNAFVIDLKVQVATRAGNEDEALAGLVVLESLDQPEFYFHRRSVVLSAFRKGVEALEAARRALAESKRPTFAMLSQVAVCEIRMNHLPSAAEHIQRLEREFSQHYHDVKVGLRCQLEVAAGRYSDALVVWERLKEKRLPVHLALRRSALKGMLSEALNPSERARIEQEIGSIESDLGNEATSDFDIYWDSRPSGNYPESPDSSPRGRAAGEP